MLFRSVPTRTYCCLWDITGAGMKTGARKNDVSKVTLPAWPGQGSGRHRLSSGLLVHLTIVRSRILFRLPLLFGTLYCIQLYLGSFESFL